MPIERIIPFSHAEYPRLLKNEKRQSIRPPLELHVLGSIDNKAAHMAAIGSRRLENDQATKDTVQNFLEGFFAEYRNTFDKSGLVIVSGMAPGGDTIAHDAALVTDVGKIATIGVSCANK